MTGSRGVELGLWMLLTLTVKHNRKKNKKVSSYVDRFQICMSQIDLVSITDGYPVIIFQICTTVCTLKTARCTPLVSVSG